MKKKLLSLIAVSAALATAGSALVACGGDDNGGNGANSSVTKEQWGAALSLSSFESNFKATIFTVNENENAAQEYVFIVGANKYGDYSMTRTLSSLTGEKQRENNYIRIVGTEKDAYYDRTSRITEVEGVDGEWQEGKWTVAYEDHRDFSDAQWTRNLENIGLSYTFKFADQYDKFEYKNGAYTYKGKDGIVVDENASEPDPDYSYSYIITATDIVVKFVDGKLASAELTMTDHYEGNYYGESETSDTTFKVTFKISYGAQTITAPEGAVPDGEDD